MSSYPCFSRGKSLQDSMTHRNVHGTHAVHTLLASRIIVCCPQVLSTCCHEFRLHPAKFGIFRERVHCVAITLRVATTKHGTWKCSTTAACFRFAQHLMLLLSASHLFRQTQSDVTRLAIMAAAFHSKPRAVRTGFVQIRDSWAYLLGLTHAGCVFIDFSTIRAVLVIPMKSTFKDGITGDRFHV